MKSFVSKFNFLYLLIFCIVLLASCDNRKIVNLCLKKGGKKYLMSNYGTGYTKGLLNRKESPSIVPSIWLAERGESLYIDPAYLELVNDFISGNYEIHDYQEKSFDGYITKGRHKVFEAKRSCESTEKVGEMIFVNNNYLTDINQTKRYHISWQKDPYVKAIKNCKLVSIMVKKPGKSNTYGNRKFLMVDLNEIVKFYGSKVKLDYVEDEGVLYIVVN